MKKLERLEKMLKENRLTRHEFITAAAALGVSTALPSSLLKGKAWAETPKKGGTFKIGVSKGSTTDSSDPALIHSAYMQNIMWGQTHNNLAEIDENGELVPELAKSWEASKDAKTWRFELKRGIEFHSGKTMDAEDVIYSVNWHRSDESKSAAKALFKDVKDIKAEGKFTVIFELESGNADFPIYLSDYHVLIEPNGSKFDSFNGTGGYIMKEFQPGVQTITTRNPNYFKEGYAHFDEVHTLSITDPIARINAVMTKSVDAIDAVPTKLADRLAKAPGVRLIEAESGQHYNEVMQTNVAPFNDNNVRLALKHAIDREQSVKLILKGHGYVGNDHPIGRNIPFFASDLEQRVYDPEKAKYYLKKAGLSKLDLELPASDGGFPGGMDHATLFREHAAKANINIIPKQEPEDGYGAKIWNVAPFCQSYWNPRPTPDMMFTIAYISTAPWNESRFNNEKFDRLHREARVELDVNKRKEMYGEMQRIVRDEGGTITSMFANFLFAASDKVRFGKIGNNWDFDSEKCAERWWFGS